MQARHLMLSLTVALSIWSPYAGACSSCGCTLNSDWSAQGIATGEGLRLDIRFDYFKQNDYRHGSSSISRADVAASGNETQGNTINRNLTIGLDYGINHDWAINLQLPVYNRSHSTYGTTYPDRDEYDTSSENGIGDIRVIGRFQGLSEDHSTGLLFGLKLPTGETKATFSSGAPLDRGLQLGTGTTDLLLGAYHFGSINRNWDYFGQALFQLPLNTHDGFRPGNAVNATAGVRYMGFESIIPQMQLNTRIEKHESGYAADRDNSGATLVYFSPGATVPINKNLQVFGFLQVPIYQHVTGDQIEPDVLISAGLHYNF